MLCLFNFCKDQIFVDLVDFLSMIIYVVLHTPCLRYNICSALLLDIRISTFLDYNCKFCEAVKNNNGGKHQ